MFITQHICFPLFSVLSYDSYEDDNLIWSIHSSDNLLLTRKIKSYVNRSFSASNIILKIVNIKAVM